MATTKKDKLFKDIKVDYNFSLSVGFLNKKNRGAPVYGKLTNFAGGLAVKRGTGGDSVDTYKVLESLIKGGRDVLNTPFEKKTDDLKRLEEFFSKPDKKNSTWKKRLINFGKSIIRKPMQLGRYKRESKNTVKQKGFSRPTILTGQLAESSEAIFNDKK